MTGPAFSRRSLLAATGASLAVSATGKSAFAQSSLPAAPIRQFAFGAAWYPEQWPLAAWSRDLQLMQAAHMNVVRVGEFAWSAMEPREGVFDFAWLDAAIAATERHGISVVLGTPTAAPPAWLTSTHPETLRLDENLTAAEHGERRQGSFSSAKYRFFCRRIAEQMALRYGRDPRVIGWQIDNELGAPSFDAEARASFHAWLQRRYGSIAELNRRWTTTYWSQTYDSFDQIPMHSKLENPGLLLDWKRWVSDTWVSFVDDQRTAIRAHATPAQFITTNTMRWNAGFDHYRLHRDLDLAAWDEYEPTGRLGWSAAAAAHDLVRGYKRRNFWIMETQPGFVNWGSNNQALPPGGVREMAWQAVGHGADAVLYWQWRSAMNGQEEYHGTLVGPDGEPQPVYAEVAALGDELARASALLAGTSPVSHVAMIHDYGSRWAIDFQRHNRDFDPVREFEAFYTPFQSAAQSVDIVPPDAPLESYRLVAAPALNVLTVEQAQRLEAYVRGGGHLLLGPRSGMKDDANGLWPSRQPGPLIELLGGRVEQFYALTGPAPVHGDTGEGAAAIWAETLSARAPDTRVVLTYGPYDGWLDGQPAALTRQVGQGSITYLGAWLDEPTMRRFTDALLKRAGVEPVLANVPEDVEVCRRVGASGGVLVLINHSQEERRVRLSGRMRDVLAGGERDEVRLKPRGVSVLSQGAGA